MTKLKRYRFEGLSFVDLSELNDFEDASGEFVLFSDHEKAVENMHEICAECSKECMYKKKLEVLEGWKLCAKQKLKEQLIQCGYPLNIPKKVEEIIDEVFK